jgi:hypothetical protein
MKYRSSLVAATILMGSASCCLGQKRHAIR